MLLADYLAVKMYDYPLKSAPFCNFAGGERPYAYLYSFK